MRKNDTAKKKSVRERKKKRMIHQCERIDAVGLRTKKSRKRAQEERARE